MRSQREQWLTVTSDLAGQRCRESIVVFTCKYLSFPSTFITLNVNNNGLLIVAPVGRKDPFCKSTNSKRLTSSSNVEM